MRLSASRFPDGPILRTGADLDIPDLAAEEVHHVSTARVVLAEYELLQHDFPELHTDNLIANQPDLALLAPAEREHAIAALIDRWLVDHAAYVSDAQAHQTLVNTPIQRDGNVTIAYRPPGYGRAIVVPHKGASTGVPNLPGPSGAGLLDLKGAGLGPGRTPSKQIGFDGLEYVGVALHDYIIKRAIDAIFEREAPTLWTVPVYAVLDLGFDVCAHHFGTSPAGMHVRRAHRRVVSQADPRLQLHGKAGWDIERLLRKYGLTAGRARFRVDIDILNGRLTVQLHGERKNDLSPAEVGLCLKVLRNQNHAQVECAHIQLVRETAWPPATGQMYDFAGLRVERAFVNPVCYVSLMADTMTWPDARDFIQPDPALCLPLKQWERQTLFGRCFELAAQFRRQEISKQEVRRQLEQSLEQLANRWQRATRSGMPSLT